MSALMNFFRPMPCTSGCGVLFHCGAGSGGHTGCGLCRPAPESCDFTVSVLGCDCNGNPIFCVKRKRLCEVNGCLTPCQRHY